MTPSTANSERRKNARRSPPSLIYVELGPSNGGMMRDLSAEGFSLRAMMPVQAGEQTPFSFALNANARIEGQGKILWIEENGRVAGIRFLALPAHAQTLIQGWIDGMLENPEPEKPAVGEAQSFEELREELRASLQPRREPPREPSTKPHWALRLSAQQEQTVPNTEAPPEIPEANTPREEEIETEPSPHEPAEPYAESVVSPEMPQFRTAREPVEIRFEPLQDQGGGAPPPAEDNSGTVVGEKRANRVDASILPDISDILIQPSTRERTSGWQQPLSEIGQEQAAKSNWTEWFTLPRAIGIMALLALTVAFSVYRQALGEGLIWLGQQLGGSTATQASPPAAEDKASPSVPNSGGTSTPSATTPPPGFPGASKPEANTLVTRPFAATVPSLPETSKNSPPAGDAASSREADAAQENGSAEYARALQLLQGKNRGADLSEAVRLLWISVEKGNPSAELSLAELYWRGEGVAHNCDQTRILLSAAARKGNTDAEQRLRQFEREGCE